MYAAVIDSVRGLETFVTDYAVQPVNEAVIRTLRPVVSLILRALLTSSLATTLWSATMPVLLRLPGRSIVRAFVEFVLDRPWIRCPFNAWCSALFVDACDILYNARANAQLYTSVGRRRFQLDVGIEHRVGGAYFPDDLLLGPVGDSFFSDDDRPVPSNVGIMQTCLLLAVLAGRHRSDLQDAILHGMLSGVTIPVLSSAPGRPASAQDPPSATLFVHNDKSWVVVAVRPPDFADLALHRLTPTSSEEWWSKTRVDRHRARDAHDVLSASLVAYLRRCRAKVYVTGTSLSGSVAILVAAELASRGIHVEGVVVAGSPPVGDASFAGWCREHLKVVWRAVNGTELRVVQRADEFVDIGEGVLTDQGENNVLYLNTSARIAPSLCLRDHNPMTTIRYLQAGLAIPEAKLANLISGPNRSVI
ncbi:Fungal lipase-like domain-containing protein [Plasmodiophora brassicae]|uniref:Fungal lipase-type domain-containing protein n=1 Tax=Plasmodiophora brassicae TaxID=37360 RepID=A0A0G4IYR6_PLABS|nr:hypothetical protein PBRA_007983 [Plasmodiophora brassicae]